MMKKPISYRFLAIVHQIMRFITENIENFCQVEIGPRKKVDSIYGAYFFVKNVNFLHYCPGASKIALMEKGGALPSEHECLRD